MAACAAMPSDDILGLPGENTGLIVTEEQAPMHLAGFRDHRHRKIARHRQVAGRQAVMRRVLAVARILADVVGTHRPQPAERRLEHGGIARQSELAEGLRRRSRQRIEHVGFDPRRPCCRRTRRTSRPTVRSRYRSPSARSDRSRGRWRSPWRRGSGFEPPLLFLQRALRDLDGGDVDHAGQRTFAARPSNAMLNMDRTRWPFKVFRRTRSRIDAGRPTAPPVARRRPLASPAG